jgi:hypothetical protein
MRARCVPENGQSATTVANTRRPHLRALPPMPAELEDTSLATWARPGDQDVFDALWRRKVAIQAWAAKFDLSGHEYSNIFEIETTHDNQIGDTR